MLPPDIVKLSGKTSGNELVDVYEKLSSLTLRLSIQVNMSKLALLFKFELQLVHCKTIRTKIAHYLFVFVIGDAELNIFSRIVSM